ncbi:MAG TPA: DUF11 domain-containing protein [Acidimicrobiales bacterium]|nr:DUF11 domain-containing protein [Acidimicrobiales bacterium]
MAKYQHQIDRTRRESSLARRVRRQRVLAVVLALLMGFVVASPGMAGADDVASGDVTEEVAAAEAAPAEAAQATPTTTAPEAGPETEPEALSTSLDTTPTAEPSEVEAPADAATDADPDTTAEASADSASATSAESTVPAESGERPAVDAGVLAANDVTAPALTPGSVVITPLGGSHLNKCQGALPTPGSGNTDKRLIGGTLVPGGTAIFQISYPVDPADVGDTFTILDCVFIGGVETLAYEIDFVPNTELFVFSFTLTIPSNATVGAQYCNVAKTTAGPSAPQQSNRKAGPACFIIGGDMRVLKVDVTGASLAGATFSVTCVPPAVAPGTFLPPIVIEGVARNTFTGVIADGEITIAGPQGTVCTVTETVPPTGYVLADPATQVGTIGTTQVTLTFVNTRALPNLSIVKTADATSVNAGSTIGFGVTVSNAGPGTATAVTLSDPLPGGTGVNWSINPAYGGPGSCAITGSAPSQTLNCSFGDMATGASATVHVTSATTAATTGSFYNLATASATNHANVTDDATVVVNQAHLGIVKTADAASVNSGSPIGFTVTVSNSGPGTATNVTLNDPLPPAAGVTWSINPAYAGPGTCSISGTAPLQTLSCAFANMASGASATVHVASGTTSATSGILVNTATAVADNHPPVVAVAQIVINRPGLSVAKVADAASVSSGSPIGFTVTVSNAGPGTATNVVLNDPLPSGTGIDWSIAPPRAGCSITGAVGAQVLSCSFGDMVTGATASVHVVSGTTTLTSGTFTNTATASASNHGPVTAIANVVVNRPNLTITKTADAASVTSGNAIGFTVTVSNAGPGAAANLTVSDPLPGGVDISWAISPATTGCSITGAAPSQTLTCTVASLASGASLAVHVVSATSVNSVGTYNNVATTRAANHPAITANATTAVVAPPVVLGVVIERAAPAVIAPAPAPAPAPVEVAAAAPATLPRTGSDPLTLLYAGLVLVVSGFSFRRWGRRA